MLSQKAQKLFVIATEDEDCNADDIVFFKVARKYVKLYYNCPESPVHFQEDWDSFYFTPTEREHILACDQAATTSPDRSPVFYVAQ